jgi:hypothetical protein
MNMPQYIVPPPPLCKNRAKFLRINKKRTNSFKNVKNIFLQPSSALKRAGKIQKLFRESEERALPGNSAWQINHRGEI